MTKGVFTHTQSSCHIAKVVLTLRHDSRQIPIASDAPPRPTSRGFLPWRFTYAGPGVRRATIMGPASANLHKSPRDVRGIGWPYRPRKQTSPNTTATALDRTPDGAGAPRAPAPRQDRACRNNRRTIRISKSVRLLLESVRRLQAGLQSFLSMRRIEARR